MAVSPPHNAPAAPIADDASDYGSEIDDATAIELLAQAESQPLKNVVLESIEEPAVKDETLHERVALRLSRLQQSPDSVHESSFKLESLISERQLREASVEVGYDEGNRNAFSPSNPAEAGPEQETVEEPDNSHQRSPIERFRTAPKKPLSVTDLVSPAWCEQQYEYSLTKYGRVKRTPAMKQGSSVHKKLEDQVHVQVSVQVETKEDRFGLRIWNVIQGLRTLRSTGLTRELEVFAVIEDEVIIGIIDEITRTCPDENMEEAMLQDQQSAKTGSRGSKSKTQQLPADQRTLTDFMTSSQNGSTLENNPAFLGALQHEKPQTYYLKDIKTRQTRSIPARGSSSRPTHMQLMLYHLLLSTLASNAVPASKVFSRYKLNADQRLSDKFFAEMANADLATYGTPPEGSSQVDPLTELLEHSTLNLLWSLMISEFALTFPVHMGQIALSPLLTAEFRTAARRQIAEDGAEEASFEEAGSLIGQRSFPFEAKVIEKYIKDEMAWWKGERETKGVDIEEAFKCRMCEFADDCTWRATKVEEGLRKARMRKEGRRKSEV